MVSDRKLIGQDSYSNLSFNGSNQWVDCGVSDRGVTNEVTLEAWVKTSYNSTTSKLVVAKFPHTSAIKNGYTLVLNSGKIAMHGRVHPNYMQSGYSSTTVSDNQWHHIVGVVTNDNIWKIYVDGTLESSIDYSTAITTLSNTAKFSIGCNTNEAGGHYYIFSGQIKGIYLRN